MESLKFENRKEEVTDRDIIEYLDKARQSAEEYEGVYRQIMDNEDLSGGILSGFMNREDLAAKFAVGKNGEPYTSTRDAAHDLIEFLASEAEGKIRAEEKARKEAKEKEKREKLERAQKDLIDYLNKARQTSTEFEDVYRHVMGAGGLNEGSYPEALVVRPDLADKFAVGKNGEPYTSTRDAAHDLIEFLVNEAEEKLRGKDKKEKKADKQDKGEDKKDPEKNESEEENNSTEEGDIPPELALVRQGDRALQKINKGYEEERGDANEAASLPELNRRENTEEPGALEDARADYLKAKRLRGNVVRGKVAGWFGRTMDALGQTMNFAGREGKRDLEEVRANYQRHLFEHRRSVVDSLTRSIEDRVRAGGISSAEGTLELRAEILDLIREEDAFIDERSVEGIEQNLFEKMKTKWRQYGKTRLVAGILLGGAALVMSDQDTAQAGAVIGARAAMGYAGTYMGVESGLERYSKLIGHRGLVHAISKKGPFINEDSLAREVFNLSPEEIKKEAARLKMLQVERGVSIYNLETLGDEGARIASMIIQRDNQLLTADIMSSGENRTGALATALMDRFAIETDERNNLIEKEVDKERFKKMARKTIAHLAGGTVGWLTGGKLFTSVENPPLPSSPDLDHILPPDIEIPTPIPGIGPEALHTVTAGENTWKIIEGHLNARDAMEGLVSGQDTHMIDALKDKFAKLSQTELNGLGFSSGNIDLIYPGDQLNITGIVNIHNILDTFADAQNLSPAEISKIVQNNAKIATWLATHRSSLTSPLNSTMIDQILSGQI